jgi:hypothetical protein
MSTATIRIEDEFRARVAAAADLSVKPAPAFILEAISEKDEQAEIDTEFNQLVEGRLAKVLATGQTVTWADAKAYLEARSRGEMAPKPAARAIRR